MGLNKALELHGKHDSWARRWLSNLEKRYLRQGNDDAAMQACNMGLAILETQKAAGLK